LLIIKVIDMNIENNTIKILLGLILLIFAVVLFGFYFAEQNSETVFFRRTPTSEPIYDVFPVRCELVLEVQEGDTLDAIAANYMVSKENIVQHNRLKSDEIAPGMILLIPMCRHMPTPTVTPNK
jgi:hypothetical protein